MKSGEGIAIATAFIISGFLFLLKVWAAIWILKFIGALP